MRAIVFTVLVGALVSSVSAQTIFEKIYQAGASPFIVELPSGNIMTGYSYSSTQNVTGFSIINQSGDVIHQRNRLIDTMLVLNAVVQIADNRFAFTSSYSKDTCGITGNSTISRRHPAIGTMDSLGNILSAYYYPSNPRCTNVIGGLIATSNNSVTAWGAGDNFYMLRIDEQALPLWSKRVFSRGGVRFIREMSNGDLLAGISMDSAGAVVTRMDQQGNVLWCKSYVRPNGMVADCLIETDDSFIITGFTDSISSTNPFIQFPSAYQPKLFMLKLNGAGEVQWCRGYHSNPNAFLPLYSGIIAKAPNGNYGVLNTLAYGSYNLYHRPLLLQCDSSGDTLWTRSIGAQGYWHVTADLAAAADGGWIFTGGVDGDLPGFNSGLPFIYKCDALGNFPCLARPHPVLMSELFPSDSSFTLNLVDVPTMAYPAFTSNANVDPIQIFDACEVANGSSSLEMRRGRPMRIRPNPNTGRFTLEVRDPLMAESYYSVYDPLGKLLYQRPLPAGATVEEIVSTPSLGAVVCKVTCGCVVVVDVLLNCGEVRA